jgi:hypothetical protein
VEARGQLHVQGHSNPTVRASGMHWIGPRAGLEIVTEKTRLEMCTWSTLKFQMHSLCHIKSNDVSSETEGITNATLVPKATVVSKVGCNSVKQHHCNNVLQGHCCENVMKDATDIHGPIYKVFLTYAKA